MALHGPCQRRGTMNLRFAALLQTNAHRWPYTSKAVNGYHQLWHRKVSKRPAVSLHRMMVVRFIQTWHRLRIDINDAEDNGDADMTTLKRIHQLVKRRRDVANSNEPHPMPMPRGQMEHLLIAFRMAE